MKPIYLSRVGISNFRTYGEDFSLELPEEPGLTVICGMNGLGKTALFDAIEWALLGEIQRLSSERLQKPEGNPLTREGAIPGSHRVELSWGSNQKVIRSGQMAPDPALLTALLKDSDWSPQIHDLAVYLRLTHFLPQATRERFLERDGKAQWNLLQGPAGVERLERLRKMLDDGKARNAFDRRILGLDKLQVEATQRIENWKRLLAEQERWMNIASAAAAISPEELQQVLRDLEAAVPANQSKASSQEPVQRLAAMRTAVETLTTSLRNRHRELSRLETSTRRYTELVQRIRTMQETHANVQKDLEEIRRVQEDAKGMVTDARTALANLEAKKVAANQLSVSALMVMDTESRRMAESKARAALEERMAGLIKHLAELEQLRADQRKQVEAYNAAVTGLEMVRQNLRALAETEQALTTLMQAARDYEAQGMDETALTKRKKSILARKTSLEQTSAGLNAKMKGATERLAAEQRSADEATRALGEVIRHLQEEDTVCPVCAQVHPPGELLRKAQASIERYSSRTASVIEELRKLQQEIEEASQAHAQCNRETAEVEASLGARGRQASEIEKQKSALLQRPGIAGASLETLPSVLKERDAALSLQELEFGAKVTALRVSDELALAAQQYEAAEKHLRGELQTANVELSQTDGILLECQAKLATAGEIIEVGGGLAALQGYRNERLREIAILESDIRDLKGQLGAHEKRLQAVTAIGAERIAKQEADEKMLAELKAESARLVSSWRDLALAGEPNESAVSEARLVVEKKVSENEEVLERIAKTVAGVEAWACRTHLSALEREVANSIKNTGANSKDQCTAILQQQSNAHIAALIRARAAKGRAEDVARKLMDLTERFSTTALEPLSARISAFNRLISPFPYEFKLSPHVTATRTRTQARVSMPSVRSDRPLERDPDWWLSEGQMSAMGLSVLLGASTTYRWSRWRALLLDDPLQNTDLIHAAAFGDVIRGLMKDDGFQVIVSSHDYDEADFLIRKCRRASLPVTKVELLSLGPSGVRYVC
jgi:DNA repair exonuclease SbcCD ATPase subunit